MTRTLAAVTRVMALAVTVGAMLLGPAGETSAAGMTDAEARIFLGQATFGPTEAGVAELKAVGSTSWLQAQFAQPASRYSGFSYLTSNSGVGCPTGSVATCFRDNYTLFPLQLQFFRNALTGNDQLRQRVALALSEILVISGQQIRQPYAMANYQQILLDHAFDNYRTILREVTLSPAMGAYLNMVNNDKPNPVRGIEPNENYAREVMQLFSIGLWKLKSDGTRMLGADGAPIPAYDQATVEGFAHAFTGWTYAPLPGATSRFTNPVNFDGQMVAFATHHDAAPKQLLNGTVTAPGLSPQADLDAAIDSLFMHPNVGPFIGRQLIQQLVTSNPSPAYVTRVAAAFDGAGGGVRGDMKAVISAVLLDPEASQPPVPARAGKLREPILLLTHLFRSLAGHSDGVWLRAQAQNLAEPVFSAPTVFNFYAPDYTLPGDPSQVGPPFGLYNAGTALGMSGILATALNGVGVAADASVPDSTGSGIDLTYWKGVAADPSVLVAQINRVLFAGRMSTDLQQVLLRGVALQSATNPLLRARTALFMAVMSPEYLVEH